MSTMAINPTAVGLRQNHPRVQQAGGPRRTARSRSALTLTARGRRVLVVVGVAFVLVGVLLGGWAVAGSPPEPIAVDTYTVSSGETLWEIAAAYTAPHEDVRNTVAELVELNGRASASLRAGEQILVPAG